ncbi:MAG: thioredoxin family protein [Natronomonas sp.]
MAESSMDVLEIGESPPGFDLPDTDGNQRSLEEFADNRAVLLVFTCNHCPYAQAKHPVLNDIAADYEDVAVVGINPNDPGQYPDDSFEEMQRRVESGEIAYDAYCFDETQDVAKAYGAVCTPDPFLLAREDSEFELAYHGRLDDAPNPDDEPTRIEIRESIDAVLADEEIPVDPTPSRGCSIKWRAGNEPDYWSDI